MEWSRKFIFIWGFALLTCKISHQAANLALHGEAVQSSLWDASITASVVIDGSPDSTYKSRSCAATLFEDNPWWRLNLRGLYEITRIEITRRSDCCEDEMKGAEIRVGKSLENNGNNNPRCAVFTVPSPVNITFNCDGAIGYFINIYNPGIGRRIQLCEIRVYGTAYAELANVAMGGEAVQSTLWSPTVLASFVIDGNADTNFFHWSCISTQGQQNPWWRVNLRGPYNIKSIEVVRRTDWQPYQLNDAEIRIGDSLENNGNNNPRCGVITAASPTVMIFDCAMKGQYVNVIIPGTYRFLQFCEIRVYGTAIISGVNIATIGKATDSAEPSSRTAALAIDKDPGFPRATCTSVPIQDNPWWQLDLVRIFRITAVKVTTVGSCCARALEGAEIRIGFRNDTSNQRCAVIALADGLLTYGYQCGVMEGRFVHIVLPGQQKNLTICNVKVYGVGLENVALKGVAFQSSSHFYTSGHASLVINGGLFKYCSVTKYEPGQWVMVDLLVPYRVTTIQITYSSDCCFSNDVRVDNTRCSIVSVHLTYLLTLDCGGAIGRYVTVYHPDTPAPLCEVEVYSTMELRGSPVFQQIPRKVTDYCSAARCNRDYIFIQEPKTWSEAQAYCRENYTDLATITSAQNMNRVFDKMGKLSKESWIGLYEDVVTWRWSLSDGDVEAEFTNWGVGEPGENSGIHHCAAIQHLGDWKVLDCDSLQFFFCFDAAGTDGTPETKTLVDTPMKWADAQSYCREYHTDMLIVRNQIENQEVQSMVPEGKLAWIALFGDAWKWSDGSYSSFRYDWQEPPDSLGGGPYCGHIYNRTWSMRPCDTKSVFLCYYYKKRHVVRIRTDFDMSGPVMKQQMLSQLEAALKSKGISDFRLHWRRSVAKQQQTTRGCVPGGT